MQRDIKAPEYVLKQPLRDLGILYPETHTGVANVDILNALPGVPRALDPFQWDALRRIVTKRLAIVQGPPGTGKTHVSVVALQLMLQNMKDGDPPILVAAHTNHAVDQLLRHIAQFEPNFIRLGGMSSDAEIKKRTLYEVKQSEKIDNPPGSLRGRALKELRRLTKEMMAILSPLTSGKDLLSASTFEDYGFISSEQRQSLVKGAKEWFSADISADDVLATWLGDDKLEAKLRIAPEHFGIEFEEPDLEFEQLKGTRSKASSKHSSAALRIVAQNQRFSVHFFLRFLIEPTWFDRENTDFL